VALLAILLASVLPNAGAGLVLCVEAGDDAHVALELAGRCCSEDVPAAPGDDGPKDDCPKDDCNDCCDAPLPGLDANRIARADLDVPDAVPSAPGGLLLALPARRVVLAPAPVPPPARGRSPAAPLSLRV
jgi:hypothetical protein